MGRVVNPFFASAYDVADTLWPVACVFVTLALITKRGEIAGAFLESRRDVATNIGLVILNYIVLAPIMVVPVLAVRDVMSAITGLAAFWLAIPEIVTLMLAILVIELTSYWRHRFEHQPGLWRFHATHHADEHLNWLSVLRKHPVAKFLELLIDTLPVIVLGLPLWSIIGAQLIRSWWSYFNHADVPWTLGFAGRWLISPAAHRLHHIRDEALMGSNYGNMLTIWDRLFGTWRDPAPHLGCVTGIAEGTRGVWGELARPWEAHYRNRAEQPPGEVAV